MEANSKIEKWFEIEPPALRVYASEGTADVFLGSP